jgi:hypothetical protein
MTARRVGSVSFPISTQAHIPHRCSACQGRVELIHSPTIRRRHPHPSRRRRPRRRPSPMPRLSLRLGFHNKVMMSQLPSASCVTCRSRTSQTGLGKDTHHPQCPFAIRAPLLPPLFLECFEWSGQRPSRSLKQGVTDCIGVASDRLQSLLCHTCGLH